MFYNSFLKFLLICIPLLLSVAFLTLIERKVLSLMGVRLGPAKVSILGILQPLSDALKLSNKSVNLVQNFAFIFYYVSSFMMIFFSIFLFSFLFCFPCTVSVKYSVMFFFLILGLNSLSSILCGWSLFSKYPLIGSVRTIAQLISYEGVLYICIFFFSSIFCCFELDMFHFFGVKNFFFLFIPCFYVWVPAMLAELNRTPYDFSEGESELVSGFNTEFGSSSFTFIFLSEYANIIFFCLLTSFLFFSVPLFFFFVIFTVIWFRASLPRFRFDKLMLLSWKFFIPFLTFYFISFFIYLF